MKTADIPQSERVQMFRAQLYAAIGKVPCRYRLMWDQQTSKHQRRAWASAAGLFMPSWRALEKWDELRASEQKKLIETSRQREQRNTVH